MRPVNDVAQKFATQWINGCDLWVLAQLKDEPPIRVAAITAKMLRYMDDSDGESFVRRLEYEGNVLLLRMKLNAPFDSYLKNTDFSLDNSRACGIL